MEQEQQVHVLCCWANEYFKACIAKGGTKKEKRTTTIISRGK